MSLQNDAAQCHAQYLPVRIICIHSKFTKRFVPAVSSLSETFLFGLAPLDWVSDLTSAMSVTVTNGLDFRLLALASALSDEVTDKTDGWLFPVSAMSVTITEPLLVDLLASTDWLLVGLEIDGVTVVLASWSDKVVAMSVSTSNCSVSAVIVGGVNC